MSAAEVGGTWPSPPTKQSVDGLMTSKKYFEILWSGELAVHSFDLCPSFLAEFGFPLRIKA